jgi:predicted GIY-YIG superfamily endonuclease
MHGPVELVYVEEVADHSTALKREVEIKRYSHARKAAMAEKQEVPSDFKGE